MDYNNNNNFNSYYNSTENGPYQTPSRKPANKFAIASLVLGVCSILLFCTIIAPLPLAALGVLFAILSKRKGQKMEGGAIAGLITSIVGALTATFLWIGIFVLGFNLIQPENREILDKQFEDVYGMDLEEYMQHFYGDDFTEEQLDDALDIISDIFD